MLRKILFFTTLVLVHPNAPCWSQEAEPAEANPAALQMTAEEAVKALRSPESAVRRQALAVLVGSKPLPATTVPTIIDIIETQTPNVPFEPLKLLEVIGPDAKAALPALTANLGKCSGQVQRNFLLALLRVGPAGEEVVPSLIKLTRSQDWHCRYLACRVLGTMGPAAKPAVTAIVERLEDGGASARRRAAQALGTLGGDVAAEATPALFKAMYDPLDPVREEAIRALGSFGKRARSAVPHLKSLVEDPDSTNRAEAAMTLWKLTKDTDFVLPHMIHHLVEGDMEWESADTIALMGPDAAPAVPALIITLDRDPSVQQAVIRALIAIGPASKPALPNLRQLLKSEEEEIRKLAKQAIAEISQGEKE